MFFAVIAIQWSLLKERKKEVSNDIIEIKKRTEKGKMSLLRVGIYRVFEEESKSNVHAPQWISLFRFIVFCTGKIKSIVYFARFGNEKLINRKK
jgi:hypothetical protein